jgi:pimeloyl-ACP methyl ester carboxylesterase
MKQMTRRNSLLIGLGLIAYGIASSGTAQAGGPKTTRVNGLSLAYRDLGRVDSETVVVALSGLGDGMDSFSGVAPALSREARVILYDRAGYGRSEPYNGQHDAVRAAAELEGLLNALGIDRRVMLLGHSLGGVYAQYFAVKYPDRVQALILDEARPTGMTKACKARKRSGCTIPTLLKYALPGAGPREADGVELAEDQAEVAGGSNVPTLILVRSGGGNPDSFDGLWLQQQKAMQSSYPNSILKQAPSGGHYVHKDAQGWFVTEVTTFLRSLPR